MSNAPPDSPSTSAQEESLLKDNKPFQVRSCTGCLYYSSERRSRGDNPICVGISRQEDQVYSLSGDSERDALKDGRRLLGFKYACLGYSMYKKNASESAESGHVELPPCIGIEFLGVRKAPHESSPVEQSTLEQSTLQQNENGDEIAGTSEIVPQPQPAHPRTISGIRGDEFAARFVRTAGLIATAVGHNLSRVAGSVKSGIDSIFYPDRRRPK